ncbi:MAG: efflux RND transporter periplasmic adaptor subunit, partial [Candidatus Aminicenantes bacterium]|nr:efflux RND transporter periplasmic adaptor subunit [Candidatus Aminicenantes bacterium]
GPEGGTVLMVVEGDKAVPKPVRAGFRDAGLIEVEGEGLTEGLVIVTTDASNMAGETKIHIIDGK